MLVLPLMVWVAAGRYRARHTAEAAEALLVVRSSLTAPSSTQRPQEFVKVWLVPAAGPFATYKVAASVVVTVALLAAKVGRCTLTPVQLVAVPLAAVALSV